MICVRGTCALTHLPLQTLGYRLWNDIMSSQRTVSVVSSFEWKYPMEGQGKALSWIGSELAAYFAYCEK